MVVAPEGDAEGGQGPGGVAGVVAQRGGEVDQPGAAQRADEDDHHPPPAGAKLAGGAGELQDLGGVGEAEGPTVTALRVRSSLRPRSRVRSATGTSCQGMAAQRASRVGWLALTTSR
jgi:hypothetical protein